MSQMYSVMQTTSEDYFVADTTFIKAISSL